MAKKQKSAAASSAAPAASAVTAKADIDDIFAKPSAPVAQQSIVDQISKDTTSVDTSKSKKKKKKVAPAEAVEETLRPTSSTKPTKRKAETTQPESAKPDTPAPEVAVFSDPSAAATSTKKQKTDVVGKGKSREQMIQDDEEERAFRDSRGDGPREFNFDTGCPSVGPSRQRRCEGLPADESVWESRTVIQLWRPRGGISRKTPLLGALVQGCFSAIIALDCHPIHSR
jgi:hypothetical protein